MPPMGERFSLNVLMLHNICKATQSIDVPVKILKENEDIFSGYIYILSKWRQFSKSLKQANITPPFRKTYRSSKQNLCLEIILPGIAKIFEKLLKKQVVLFMDEFLSKHYCGFRKGFGTQHCLFTMWEKRK